MYYEPITLEKALELEDKGQIMIVDCSIDTDDKWHEKAGEWKNNFNLLRTKARHVDPDRLMKWCKARYTIEHSIGCTNSDTQTYEWRFLYGLESPEIANLTQSDSIEYIYALTNKGYPDLVKIGMTRNTPQHRVNQINGTGTIDVWEVRFALPVRPGTSMQVEQQVHKFFQSRRYHAVYENDREMFYVSLFEAMDKIREVGALFQVGDPILY